MRNITKTKIIDLLQPKLDGLGLSASDIDTKESLLYQGVLDSISFLEFIVDIESTFNVEFDFSDLDPAEFTSIDNLVELIDNGN
ncbi:acyl carrier protein [Francisella sp. 19X1-34]|uniref:acyl carrier protein n=1 Tax=Francisella sp. 19X1-34 TaxID=3087177 RepID=UPI002E36F852|nr:acyl carrier protein [Francisella sp. 19X1-34]MED7787522.1 acyl carrier protein [Francisella sp. 19X1-34]